MSSYGSEGPRTTAQLLEKFVDFSVLGGMFAVDAISKAAKQVLEHKDEVREQFKNSIICADAWIRSAEDWEKFWHKFTEGK